MMYKVDLEHSVWKKPPKRNNKQEVHTCWSKKPRKKIFFLFDYEIVIKSQTHNGIGQVGGGFGRLVSFVVTMSVKVAQTSFSFCKRLLLKVLT